MRSRILPVIGVSAAAALAVGISFAPMASAQKTHMQTSHQSATSAAKTVASAKKACFSQTKGATGSLVVSQNFTEAGDDGYDSQGADDLTIKKTCKVGSVSATGGYFNGSGPATSETVTFYANTKNKPGKVIQSVTAKGKDTAGSFAITLKKPVTLKPGTYWISVQVNMDATVGGEWGWNTGDQQGKPALWQNPGDNFATGCTKYKLMTSCIGAGPGPDFLFSIAK